MAIYLYQKIESLLWDKVLTCYECILISLNTRFLMRIIDTKMSEEATAAYYYKAVGLLVPSVWFWYHDTARDRTHNLQFALRPSFLRFLAQGEIYLQLMSPTTSLLLIINDEMIKTGHSFIIKVILVNENRFLCSSMKTPGVDQGGMKTYLHFLAVFILFTCLNYENKYLKILMGFGNICNLIIHNLFYHLYNKTKFEFLHLT